MKVPFCKMCAVKWDKIKTIGDQDAVEDVESDSDVEVEVIFLIINLLEVTIL